MSKGEAALAMMLRAYGVEHEREYRWLAGRRFRADFAIPWARLLIEVQGGAFLPGGGRHNRGAGYEQDLVRQNLAQVHGWRMLQYTTGMVTSGEAIVQIMEMLSWLAPGSTTPPGGSGASG